MTSSNATIEQKIAGLYGLVTLPWFYEGLQNLLGAARAHKQFFSQWAKTNADSDVLDLGCGPGISLPYITFRSYHGIDLNPQHIAKIASQNIPNTSFETGAAQDVVPNSTREYDVILALGFLHHLHDDHVTSLLDAALQKLRPNGSIFFLEPVFVPHQHIIARTLKNLDSGQHIRAAEDYTRLLSRDGFSLTSHISNDLLRIPYNHFWGRLTRNA